MDAKTPIETHMHAAERTAMNAFAPLSEMMNQSRALFEKSMSAMRHETLELLGRMHDRNGEMLTEMQSSPTVTSWATAQEKWFGDLSRDMLNASRRFHQTTRHLMADSIEGVGQSLRTGAIAHAAEDAADTAAHVAETDAKAVHEAAAPAMHEAAAVMHDEAPVQNGYAPMPTQQEYNS